MATYISGFVKDCMSRALFRIMDVANDACLQELTWEDLGFLGRSWGLGFKN